MDFIQNLALGFETAVTPLNLGYSFVGVLLGTLVGVLPGIGPIATISMLLPATLYLSPTSSLIMLAGIFYGAQYGGSTSAILLRLPGEASAVVTTLDGYQMARNGQAGTALSIAAIASFFAGCVGTLVLASMAPLIAEVALQFRATEYFALMLLGLVAAIVLSSGSLLKASGMIILGVCFGIVGTDTNTGVARMTFGLPELAGGLGIVPVVLGLFGITEVLSNLRNTEERQLVSSRISGIWPSFAVLKSVFPAILRGTGIGTLIGALPGAGVTLSTFAAYAVEKKVAADPSRFGEGAPEGVAAPEAANNAAAQMSFVPLLTLGIPSNGVMAVMMSAMLIQNVRPGPQVITSSPDLFWGIVASMWIGNLFLVVLNLPLIGLWVRLLLIPYRILFLIIVLLCGIGIYSVQYSVFDLYVGIAFAVLGYVALKLKLEVVPLLMGFILGPMLEDYFRRAMQLSQGDPMVFLTRPVSATLLAIAATIIIVAVIPTIREKREDVLTE